MMRGKGIKYQVIMILGAIFIIGGITDLGTGIEALFGTTTKPRQFSDLFFSLFFLAIGVFMIRAAQIQYRGGWASIIGIFLAFFGLYIPIYEHDKFSCGNPAEPMFAIVSSTLFIALGIMFIYFGHQRHVRAPASRNSLHVKYDDTQVEASTDRQPWRLDLHRLPFSLGFLWFFEILMGFSTIVFIFLLVLPIPDEELNRGDMFESLFFLVLGLIVVGYMIQSKRKQASQEDSPQHM